MASRIDERLWSRRQNRRSTTSGAILRHGVERFQSSPMNSGPVSMDLDAVSGTTALAKTAAERLEYQRQGRYWGCGQLGHIQEKCPTNPSKLFSLAVSGREDTSPENDELGTQDVSSVSGRSSICSCDDCKKWAGRRASGVSEAAGVSNITDAIANFVVISGWVLAAPRSNRFEGRQ